jgi:hypothetical protein
MLVRAVAFDMGGVLEVPTNGYAGELNTGLADSFQRLRPRYRTAILSNAAAGGRREEDRRYVPSCYWRRWSQAEPEGEACHDDCLPCRQAAGAARQMGEYGPAGWLDQVTGLLLGSRRHGGKGRPGRPTLADRGLGLRSPAGRYQLAKRGQRPGQPPAD